MEQILIRGLPVGTKAALHARAQRHCRSLEDEVRTLGGNVKAIQQTLGHAPRP